MICQHTSCGREFEPKPLGYNARYCSSGCKAAAYKGRLRQRAPQVLQAQRTRSYSRIKADPARYAGHLASTRTSAQKVRDWLAKYKLERGCVDCGYKEHSAALQLDHEGEKSIEIADARSSVQRLLDEIERGQCKVRCANCHSIRTWERKQQEAANVAG